MEELFIKVQDGLELSAIYSKVENPKALVQIIHGMVEHKERYLYLINKLNEAGYTVIITDSRGHGKSINEKYPHGHIESIDELVSDQYEVTKFIKEKNPNKDLYIFSHSFGTCISRNYIMKHDDEIKKLIVSGTVASNPGAPLGAHIAKKKMWRPVPERRGCSPPPAAAISRLRRWDAPAAVRTRRSGFPLQLRSAATAPHCRWSRNRCSRRDKHRSWGVTSLRVK